MPAPLTAAHTIMSFDLVFFGGTGDLTWRKLMPALFQAFRHGKLPAGRAHPGGGARRAQRRRVPRLHPRALRRGRERSKRPERRGVRPLRRDAALPAHGPVPARALRRAEDLDRRARRRHRGAVPGHQPAPVPGDLRAARRGRPERPERARGAGKAARPRPGQRAGDQPRGALGLRAKQQALPHRPLPGQAGGAEPDGAALRQRAVRAAVAAREHRQHPDHAGRGPGRGHARRLLRQAPARCAT